MRCAEQADAEGVASLLEGMANRRAVFNSFLWAAEKGAAAVAVCEGQIVGVATLQLAISLPLLQTGFNLESVVDLDQHSPESHAEVDVLCMNPIFGHRYINCPQNVPE